MKPRPRDASPFTVAQIAIEEALTLRFVPPENAGDNSGSDIQGRFLNRHGAGYWLTLCTFPESPRREEWR
jgi:hypothetical protein